MSIQYVGTSSQDTLAYPDILRVTFGQTPHFYVPDSVASIALSQAIDRMVSVVDQGGDGLAVGSDPAVADGSLAVTIDFAPTDPNGQVSVAGIVNLLQGSLTTPAEMFSDTQIQRVEKIRASSGTGTTGTTGRGSVTGTIEQQLQATSLGAELAKYFGTAVKGVIIVGGVAAAVYFWPTISRAFKSRQHASDG